MIKKGQTSGQYKGIEYEVAKVEGHRDRWYWVVNGITSLPEYRSTKGGALYMAHDRVDAMLNNESAGLKSWEEIEQEMSIAGQPDKAVAVGKQVMALISQNMDIKNIPSIDNSVFALERVILELKGMEKIERDRQTLK